MSVPAPDVPPPRSFARNLVPTLAFVLLAGIVGPIFLVVGLSLPADDPNDAWLLPVGIAITVVDVLVAVMVAHHRTDRQRRTWELRTRGRRARGRVLSFEQTNVRINDQPQVVIRLLIEGDDIAPFEAQARTVVRDVHVPLLHTGVLPVLIDPETDAWEIDWEAAQVVSPTALAGSAEPERPAAERLAELDDLLRRDLVSREEYDAARARILEDL
ncbi:SHOCT domain-containing protein [Nocardioides sp. J54]|uniref:SHOCT domain-containing protein n=1 Tax=Nocardioides sp. J54 TaxID=935866 RepID=UPI0012FC4A00|nr:SHOCT domain-containing protein [Nocardioides sp. J54]